MVARRSPKPLVRVRPLLLLLYYMVILVQLAERLIVAQEVAGSNPAYHIRISMLLWAKQIGFYL